MTQKSQTPDERFLVKFYQTAVQSGDPCVPMDYRGIAKSLGQKETAMKNIIKHLAQANFVKKIDENVLYLTPRGCQFALDTIEDWKI
ncbi:MAG: hypothetical protein V4487_02580 [Chlamydiota bacterium]